MAIEKDAEILALEKEVAELSVKLKKEEDEYSRLVKENKHIREELIKLRDIVLRKREEHLNLSDIVKNAKKRFFG